MAARQRKPGPPSVSQVLKRFKDSGGLIHWAYLRGLSGGKLYGDEVDFGKHVEAQIKARVRGEERPKIPPGIDVRLVSKCLDDWDQWVDEHEVQMLHCQVSLASATLGLTGRIDMVGLYEGAPAVLELKASKKIYLDMLLQCSAYHLLLSGHNAMTELAFASHPRRSVVVRIDRDDGSLHEKVFDSAMLELGERMFLNLLAAYNLERSLVPCLD